MRKKRFWNKGVIWVFFLGLFSQACLDTYNPPAITAPNSYLVVQGVLGDSRSYVQLGRTKNLASEDEFTEAGASISVEDEAGSLVAELFQNELGTYVTEIPLQLNERYRIRINTSDNKRYVSDYVTILPTPEIDSVGYDFENGGVQFHVSTNDPESDTRYYRWDFTETWQFSSNFYSYLVWEDNMLKDRDLINNQIFYCWRTRESTEILVASTVRLAEDKVFKAPLTFLDPLRDSRLSIRYSILVRQYAMSQEAFEFWDVMKRNSENLGTFFDPQPSQLPSNVTNVQNPEEPVVGWVSGAQVREARRFILRSEVPYQVNSGRLGVCTLDSLGLDQAELEEAFGGGFLLPVEPIMNMFGVISGYTGAASNCVDCRVRGGTNQRPTFW